MQEVSRDKIRTRPAQIRLVTLEAEEVRHPCALGRYFYIPRPRSHIKLYIEYDFNYRKVYGCRTSSALEEVGHVS